MLLVTILLVTILLVTNTLVTILLVVAKKIIMETPFIFGKLASGGKFTNRESELTDLLNNFKTGTNTILISPRRWGKSSLVDKAAEVINHESPEIVIVKIDLFNIRTEAEFYNELADKVLKATSGKFEDIKEYVQKFFKQLMPKISLSPSPELEFSLSIDNNELLKQPDEIIDLAEKIGASKKLKMRICIDEFQNIGFFDDPLAFQKKLRSHWQTHQNVAYFLYGSKRNMLLEVFTSPSMPFYNFGSIMFLKKISLDRWKSFIVKQFEGTGKKISPELAGIIAQNAECHSYYVQQLAQICWLRTSAEITLEIVNESFESLILQLSLLFQNITETLSTNQLNFLKAIIKGEEKLSSKEVIQKYNLGTSANVSRVRHALINKEIIDQTGGEIQILDPIYKAWLQNFYFINSAK